MVDMGLANLTSWFFFSMGALGLVVVDAGVWAGGLANQGAQGVHVERVEHVEHLGALLSQGS